MRQSAFLFALLVAAQAQAAIPRCGTDDFGNTVCMDQDGVVTTTPKVANEKNDDAAAAAQSGRDADREDQQRRPRCAIDPFGNTVCR